MVQRCGRKRCPSVFILVQSPLSQSTQDPRSDRSSRCHNATFPFLFPFFRPALSPITSRDRARFSVSAHCAMSSRVYRSIDPPMVTGHPDDIITRPSPGRVSIQWAPQRRPGSRFRRRVPSNQQPRIHLQDSHHKILVVVTHTRSLADLDGCLTEGRTCSVIQAWLSCYSTYSSR